MAIDVRPLHPVIGAEVSGLDLQQPVSDADAATLRHWFDEHALLLVRQPGLSADEQRRFVEALGPVADPHGHISNVEADGYQPEWRLLWHSDFAFTPHPLLGISLYALDIGEGCAPTRFASAAHGAATLPAPLRARLEGLELVHLANLSGTGREDVRQREADYGGPDIPAQVYPRATRPVLWRHPRTGAELLWVSQQQASHIVGITYEESEVLLEEVFAHLYRDEVVYEHHWQVGDLLLWDNLALHHARPEAPVTVRRSLRRFTMSERTLAEILGGLRFEDRPDVHKKVETA